MKKLEELIQDREIEGKRTVEFKEDISAYLTEIVLNKLSNHQIK